MSDDLFNEVMLEVIKNNMKQNMIIDIEKRLTPINNICQFIEIINLITIKVAFVVRLDTIVMNVILHNVGYPAYGNINRDVIKIAKSHAKKKLNELLTSAKFVTIQFHEKKYCDMWADNIHVNNWLIENKYAIRIN